MDKKKIPEDILVVTEDTEDILLEEVEVDEVVDVVMRRWKKMR